MNDLDKRYATLRARAALVGATLREVHNDRGETVYVLTRAAFTKALPTTTSVEHALTHLERMHGSA